MSRRRACFVGIVLAAASCDFAPLPPTHAPAGAAPALDPASPGAVELPGDPLPEPFPWRFAVAGGSAVAAAAALMLRRRALRVPPVGPAAAPPQRPHAAPEGPHVAALQRLERLREREPRDADEICADHGETASIVRDYVTERFVIQAREMTTDEALDSLTAQHALLAAVLVPCDLVKFARLQPSSADRVRLLDAAVALVRQTQAP